MAVIAAIVAVTAVHVSSSINVTAWLEALAAIVTIGGGALYIWKQSKSQRARNDRFDRDWYGEAERPGVPVRPGVLEQLLSLTTDVAAIKVEVFPNHGGSIKDAVTRMDTRLETVELDVRGIHEKLDKPDVHA